MVYVGLDTGFGLKFSDKTFLSKVVVSILEAVLGRVADELIVDRVDLLELVMGLGFKSFLVVEAGSGRFFKV